MLSQPYGHPHQGVQGPQNMPGDVDRQELFATAGAHAQRLACSLIKHGRALISWLHQGDLSLTKEGFEERFGREPRKDDLTILCCKQDDPTDQVLCNSHTAISWSALHT